MAVRVRLLGTGGAANECRRQACLLVERADGAGGPILLDTGNGLDVVRQLLAAGRDPCEVRDVFVSHQHADHAGGLDPLLLWSVLRTMRESGGPPIEETRVYAEPRIVDALRRLFAATATTIETLYRGRLRLVSVRDGETTELPNGGRLTPFLVDHEPRGGGAVGCVVELAGVRLVYSGDTRPSERLVEMARGADALFHEAGGTEDRAEYVHRQGHSTAADAGRAAKAAGVGRLVLTHLPGELPGDGPTEPLLAEARAAFGGPVELASDLATIDL
jgi:ribonuclease BN (tRNA processing enzyme)